MDYNKFQEKVDESTLSPSEDKVANYLLDNFLSIPFCTIQTICTEAHVSKATVGRFLNKIGFTGFSYFQKDVSRVLKRHEMKPPIQMIDNCTTQSKLLDEHFNEAINNLEQMHASISNEQLELAIDYLSQEKGTLYIFGAASSKSLAHYFYTLAQYLRKNVVLLEGDLSLLPHKLVDVTKDDRLLAISFYRYSKIVVQVSHYFHQKQAKIIIITNNKVNPFSDHCDLQFVVPSQTSGPFQSRSIAFILLELLIKGLSARNPDKHRFEEMETLFTDLKVFKSRLKRSYHPE